MELEMFFEVYPITEASSLVEMLAALALNIVLQLAGAVFIAAIVIYHFYRNIMAGKYEPETRHRFAVVSTIATMLIPVLNLLVYEWVILVPTAPLKINAFLTMNIIAAIWLIVMNFNAARREWNHGQEEISRQR